MGGRIHDEGQRFHDGNGHARAALDSAVDAIVTTDGRGIVQSFNPAAERLFG